ncbi:uncharacterized protein LOC144715301 [Wolffia australiana]
MVLTLKLKMEKLEEGTSSHPSSDDGEKHSLPEPWFDGSHREDVVADFLYDCDWYFGKRQLSDERKVLQASYFLIDEAKSWWRQREECGNWPPPTYEELMREIKESFMPHNTAWIARGELENLKMMGNPREYVGQFVSIIWRITDMSEADKLHRFAKGLPHGLQTELERRQCRDLNSAYKVVEGMELRPSRPAKTEDKPVKGNKPRQERAEAPSATKQSRPEKEVQARPRQESRQGQESETVEKEFRRGTAAATNVNAMVVPSAQSDVPQGSSTVTLNPLQFLVALQGGAPVQYEGLNLLHVSVLINIKPSTAMVDTGATHNLLAEKEARKLGLKLSPSAGKIKAVNSEARDIVGVAKGVLLQVGTWEGRTNFMVSPIDDFTVVLSLDLLMGSHVVVFPEYRGVLFPEGFHPCFKDVKWQWTDRCQRAFDKLKSAVSSEPVLRLPKFNKPYEDEHPVAYESRKLNDTERRYSVHEKEMTAMVHCLRVWCHYLLGGKFMVYTDNVATSCFESQKKLTPKEPRWQDFLAELDFDLKYKPGRANQVADALNKTEKAKATGKLEPLPRASRPWESISMDFVTCLSRVGGHDAILVVVDRFSKYATFIPTTSKVHADGVHGSKLIFSTSFHPQTDGQTEHVDSMLEEYLWHYVSVNQENWVELLEVAQFAHYINRSSATGHSPFEIATGRQPLTPPEVVKRKGNRHFPVAFRFARDYHALIEEAREALERAAQRMKKYADQHKRDVEFQVGDKVLLKTNA